MEVDAIKEKLQNLLQNNLLQNDVKVLTWKELNKDLYNIMQMEKVAVFCVLSLILLIAIFNVFASLAMTVMEKKQEIAIFKAIGASDKFISKIYLYEGMFIGIIGTLIGLLIGILLVLGQDAFEWLKISSNTYLIDAIPVIINGYEIAIVCIFSLLLAFIATIYPAKKANQLIISQAIRSE
jgi:lipoprotein-releasing system permease protein